MTSRLSGARSNHLSYRPITEPFARLNGAQFYINNQLKTGIIARTLVSLDLDMWPTLVGSHIVLLRKEVIQPQLPLRLPCYDLAPVVSITLGIAILAVRQTTSGAPNFRGLTGGVYKARERIHRSVLICDY